MLHLCPAKRSKTTSLRQSLFARVVPLNTLPENIRRSQSLCGFQKSIRVYFKNLVCVIRGLYYYGKICMCYTRSIYGKICSYIGRSPGFVLLSVTILP